MPVAPTSTKSGTSGRRLIVVGFGQGPLYQLRCNQASPEFSRPKPLSTALLAQCATTLDIPAPQASRDHRIASRYTSGTTEGLTPIFLRDERRHSQSLFS